MCTEYKYEQVVYYDLLQCTEKIFVCSIPTVMQPSWFGLGCTVLENMHVVVLLNTAGSFC